MSPIELEEAKEHLGELIDQAARGEEVIIARNHQPVVRLVPIPAGRGGNSGARKG